MKKSLSTTTVYAPNDNVTVTVKNTPVTDEVSQQRMGYKAIVTVKIKRPVTEDELRFGTDDEIADFVAGVDYTDPQQEMFN